MKKSLGITVSLILTANLALADEATCKRVLNDCNDALNAEIHANHLQAQLLKDHEAKEALQADRISQLEARDSAWYRQPYVWFILGSLAGGYLVNEIRH